MTKHLLISPDGEKAILEIGWDPETCSIRFKFRILDPDDQSWMEFPADEVKVDEKISKEILKIALNHKKTDIKQLNKKKEEP
jgi:hypothetical protein